MAGCHVAIGLALSLGLTGGACTATGSSTASARGGGDHGSHSTPRRQTFHTQIVSGTGAYADDTGTAAIDLHPHGSGSSRHVRVVFRGSRCGNTPHCLHLSGTLTGQLTRSGHQLPDTGSVFAVKAAGRLTELGRVTGLGSVHGTGFITAGRELMNLTLANSSGSVTLRGRSGVVKGFTSP